MYPNFHNMGHPSPQQQSGPQLSHVEYTLAINTRNRDKTKYIEPNDCVVPINIAQQSMPVVRMYLGSVEMPLTQQTIEEEWSRIYFDNGLSFALPLASLGNPAQLPGTITALPDPAFDSVAISVRDTTNTKYTAYVPPLLNPARLLLIDSVPHRFIIQTYAPHSLNLLDHWPITQPMQIIGVNGVVSIPLTSGSDIQILDKFTFQITDSTMSMAQLSVMDLIGYVWAPPIRTPSIAAAVLTDAVNDALDAESSPTRFQITYNLQTSKFQILSTDISTYVPSYTAVPALYAAAAPGDGAIPRTLGFACATIPLPYVAASFSGRATTSEKVSASSPHNCMSSVRIEPGFYREADIGILLSEIQLEFNRFYFEPPCDLASATEPAIVVEGACGECYVISIPFGRYQPETLAAELELQLNATLPQYSAMKTYTVTFEANLGSDTPPPAPGVITGRFVFRTLYEGYQFALLFDDPRTTIASKLGFDPLCYRGQMSFEGSIVYVPVRNCSSCSITSTAALLYPNDIYLPFVNQINRTLGLQICARKPISDASAQVPVVSTPNYTTMDITTPTAHGFQVDDIVSILFTAATPPEQTRTARVVAVVDAFTFTVDVSGFIALLNLDIPPGSFPTTVCVQQYETPLINIYFTDERDTFYNPLYAQMLGFPSETVEWGTYGYPIRAPNQFAMATPDYVLLEFVTPNESAYIQHQWGNETKTRLFGKIVFYPTLRLERNYPIESIFQGNRNINQLHIRVYNPNHTLYNFHGRDWSMTIVLVVLSGTVNQLCY